MQLENKILKSFIKYEGKEVEGLDLIVCMPDLETWEEEHECVVEETRANGKVWNVTCTRNGNVKDTYML